MDFEKQVKPTLELISGRLGLKGPAYDTPEGRQREKTIRLMFREGYISESVARKRFEGLLMPPGLIDAAIEHELVERKVRSSS